MTIQMAEVPAPTRGSGPVVCDDPKCVGHRESCNFGRGHQWATWFENGHLMRTPDTFHCDTCGGVCIADEPDPEPVCRRCEQPNSGGAYCDQCGFHQEDPGTEPVPPTNE